MKVKEESSPRLSLAAPCFNEAQGVARVLTYWNSVLDRAPFACEIVICNDGSTDSTLQVLEELQRSIPRLRVIHFSENGGYGRALSAAIAATRGEYVATLDSDGQFDPGDALILLKKLEEEGLDAVNGYRVKKKDTPLRVAADRGLNRLVRTLFRVDFKDTNCALKVVKGELLRRTPIEARGYPTPTELVLRLQASGARVGEAPVSHEERLEGSSKLRPFRTAWEMLRFLLYLRARLALYRGKVLVQP